MAIRVSALMRHRAQFGSRASGLFTR
jgi:hypothetical protein